MFTLLTFFISLLSAQSVFPSTTFQPTMMPSCQPCQTCNCFSAPQVPSTPCPVCPPPPPPCQTCQLPPQPVAEGCNDQLKYHSDASNKRGCQDAMRANAQTSGQNSYADDRCAAQNAKLKMNADINTQNNKFREVNENEFLVHKKNAREECGDSSSRTACVDLDAGSGCRAAQSHNDACQSSMAAGRDRSARAEDCAQTNIDGFRSGYSFRPRGCPACFF